MWWIYALLSAVFAAATAILAKVGVTGVDSNLATAVRTTVILVVAWGIFLTVGDPHSLTLLTRRNILFLVLSGIATGLSWIFYFKALQMGKASQVAPIDKTSLVMVLVFAAIFLGEPLGWKTVLGGLMIVGGTLVIIL
jgi:transporter family protein